MKHAFRLRPGQDLRQEIQAYVEKHQIAAGFVATCVGSTQHAVLRMAGAKAVKEFPGKQEIVSLVGTVSMKGSHLHLAISDESGVVCGGHLKDGTIVGTTAEIVLGEIEGATFSREPDDETGFDELVVTDA